MENKTILIYDSVQFFIPYMEEKGVKCYPSFKRINRFFRPLRKMSGNINTLSPIWYGEWKFEMKTVDTVIIFATNRYDFIEYICDRYKEVRVIVWYWNPIARCFNPNLLKRDNLEYWSFDLVDCETYNLRYNTTFFFNNINIDNLEKEYDVLFLGADKGRKVHLDELQIKLNEVGTTTCFHIVPDKNSENPDNIKFIPYSNYLGQVSHCRAILDYLQEGQYGQTLRPIEALFLKKKLITNDKSIISQKFYDANNIFVIGIDDLENIPDFIESDYRNLSEDIVNYFDFENWINRFFINE